MCQAAELVGMAMVHSLVEEAQTWITHNVGEANEATAESECDSAAAPDPQQTSAEPETFKPVLDAKASGGKWHFVVGLVVRIQNSSFLINCLFCIFTEVGCTHGLCSAVHLWSHCDIFLYALYVKATCCC